MTTIPTFRTGKILRRLHAISVVVLLLAAFSFSLSAAMASKATAQKNAAKVSIVDFQFMPAEITIAAGESVTWTNNDGAPHGLEYSDRAPGTDLLLPGASFSRRFDKPGAYEYNCSVHPYMTGRVVVRPQ